MTPDEMRDAIEAVYADTIKGCGVYPAEIPAGVTPQDVFEVMPESVESLPPDEFREIAKRVGFSLGIKAIDAAVDLPDSDHFARITVQDRPAAKAASQGGRGIPRVRPRAFVVHALGWSSKPAPAYVHEKSWPHAIGADVPETSKRPKAAA